MKTWKYSQDFKDSIVELAKRGHSANSLSREYDLATTTVLRWLREAKTIDFKGKKISVKDYLKLKKENERLKEEINILKRAAVLGQR